MASESVVVRNQSGAEWVISLDPSNWATEHMQRQIDSGELTVVPAKKLPRKSAPVSADSDDE